nr:hypothetical protein [uncultured Pseudodesulfovibrio sp.]
MIVCAHEEMRSKYQFCLDETQYGKQEESFFKGRVDYHKQEREAYKNRHGWRFNKSGTKDAFILADEREQYLAYKHMCGRNHADIMSLIKDHLDDNGDDWTINIGAELNIHDLAVGFRFAAEMLIVALLTSFEYFDCKTMKMNEAIGFYDSMLKELKRLENEQTP